ncbi:hypothetical protein SAMD00024442_21_43 [Candidatus Symbiothrix dinenymphae]|nr:hypothetical protein SAMD00024442_21_43 [Candidatus Symbiothrix dinenymphae]
MKNILILCDAFPPAFAPRVGYLCRYLPSLGWNPIVVTENQTEQMYSHLTKNENVTYVNFFLNRNNQFSKLRYFFVFMADYLFGYKKRIIKKQANKVLKRNNIALILSSNSFQTYFAKAAQELSEEYHIPFISDIRDIFEQFPNNEYTSKLLIKSSKINELIAKKNQNRLIRQRNKVLQQANAVITVSDWHKQFLQKFNPNVTLIFNGFDPELFDYKEIKTEQFRITYAGRIESLAVKNPTLLFQAIKRLSINNLIDKKTVRLDFYLINESSKQIIQSLANEHDINDFVSVFGTIQNSEVPDILNKSSVLLALANKTTDEHSPKGIVGTKLFEYLAVEKPILCVTNDEGIMAEIISNSNAGISASTVEEVADFILAKFQEWQAQGATHQRVNKDYIQQFSRAKQAQQFGNVFSNIVKQQQK